jgi:hypothetical protein
MNGGTILAPSQPALRMAPPSPARVIVGSGVVDLPVTVTLPSVCRCFSLSAIRRLHRAASQGTTERNPPSGSNRLDLPSLVVDRLADPFKRTSQSVDFILKIIVDRLLGACPSNRKSPSPAKQNSHWGKLR